MNVRAGVARDFGSWGYKQTSVLDTSHRAYSPWIHLGTASECSTCGRESPERRVTLGAGFSVPTDDGCCPRKKS